MKKILYVVVLITLVLSACSQSQDKVESILKQITPPSQPQPGKATVVGQVVEFNSGDPLGNVVIRLAEAYREGDGGVFALNHYSSPGARADSQGYFIFPDLVPGEYVVVVGEGENINDYDIIEDGNTKKAKIWSAPADQVSDWGVIKAYVIFR